MADPERIRWPAYFDPRDAPVYGRNTLNITAKPEAIVLTRLLSVAFAASVTTATRHV